MMLAPWPRCHDASRFGCSGARSGLGAQRLRYGRAASARRLRWSDEVATRSTYGNRRIRRLDQPSHDRPRRARHGQRAGWGVPASRFVGLARRVRAERTSDDRRSSSGISLVCRSARAEPGGAVALGDAHLSGGHSLGRRMDLSHCCEACRMTESSVMLRQHVDGFGVGRLQRAGYDGGAMFRVLVDACVWLDLARDRRQHAVVGRSS